MFAYTIKGWGLPIAGDPLNPRQCSPSSRSELRQACGRTTENEWDRFPLDSDAGRLCARVGQELNNESVKPRPFVDVPLAASGHEQGGVDPGDVRPGAHGVGR